MSTRRAAAASASKDDSKAGTAKRGRPASSKKPSPQSPVARGTLTGSKEEPKQTSSKSTVPVKRTREVEIIATEPPAKRRSGRERQVKSARELLGLSPADEIKKEEPRKTVKQSLVKQSPVKASSIAKSIVVVPASPRQSQRKATESKNKIENQTDKNREENQTDKNKEENQTDKNKAENQIDIPKEQQESGTVQMYEVTEIEPEEKKDKATTSCETVPQMETVQCTDSEKSPAIEAVDVNASTTENTQIVNEENENVQKVILRKDFASGSGTTIEETKSMAEQFEGLVDPETGLIIDDANPGDIQQIPTTIGGSVDHVMFANSAGITATIDSSAVNVQSVSNEAGEHQYFVLTTSEHDDDAPTEDGGEKQSKADHHTLQGTDMTLMDALERQEEEPQLRSLPITQSVVSNTLHQPFNVRDRRLLSKTHFTNSPMTSQELEAAPVSKSGRCVPMRQVVVSPELQDLINNLKESDQMENHIVNTGMIEGMRNKFACKHCGEDIPNRHYFRKHITGAHKELDYKPWKCPLCDYKSIIKASIARHINIHSDMKPYRCLECGKGFTFRQKLQIHMKYHKDQRDHPCVLCDMAFHELKTLKTHLAKIHGIEKPKAFIDKYRGNPLTSVLIQLDDTAEPTHGFLLPKEERPSKPAKFLTPGEALQKQLMARADAEEKRRQQQQQLQQQHQQQQQQEEMHHHQQFVNDPQQLIEVLPSQQEQQIQFLTQPHEEIEEEYHSQQQQANVIPHMANQQQLQQHEQQHEHEQEFTHQDAMMQVQNIEQDGNGGHIVEIQVSDTVRGGETVDDETIQNLLRLGWQIQKPGEEEEIQQQQQEQEQEQQEQQQGQHEPQEHQQQMQQVEHEQQQYLYMEQQEEEGPSEEVQTDQVTVDPLTGENSEVSVLLARHRKSCTYGTRKTQLRTCRFKLGLEGNYTPIKSENKSSAPLDGEVELNPKEEGEIINATLQNEEEEEEEQDKELMELPAEEGEVEEGEVVEEEKEDVKPVKTKSSTNKVKVINNQKIVSENQIEDELKKYCHVDTSSILSRIVFTCTLCPEKLFNTDTKEHKEQKGHNQFFSKTQFCAHLEVQHPEVKPWMCVTCGFKCRMRTSLIAHSKTHELVRKYECTVCFKRFLFKQKLNVHMRTHVNLRAHQCPSCDKRFNETTDLTRHMKRCHTSKRSTPHVCVECGKAFRDAESLDRHMGTHDPDKRYLCHYCNHYYRSKGSLAQHIKSHTCMFHCEICNRNFGSYSGFMAHKVMHDQSFEGFECEECGKRLHTKGSFTRHKTVAHSEDRPYSCSQCPKSFKTKKDLKNHGAVHSIVRAHSCSECSFTCKRMESLKIHMRRHSEVKPYQCGLCGKQYTQRSSLDAHLRHHTGQAEATCNICRREFSSKYLLRKHIQSSHLNALPLESQQIVDALKGRGDEGLTVYMCEECNSVFLSQDDLAVHILAEHMKQGFSSASTSATQLGEVATASTSSQDISLDTGLPSSGFSEHGLDSPSGGEHQLQYITVDQPGGSKVVSLLHPVSQSNSSSANTTSLLDNTSTAPSIYMTEEEMAGVKQEEQEVLQPTMVHMGDSVLPMDMDSLLTGGGEEQQQHVVVLEEAGIVAETVEVLQD